MSDDKRPKIKRAVPPAQIVERTAPAPKPVVVVPAKPVAMAPSKPIEAAPPKPIVATPKPVEATPAKPIEAAPAKPAAVMPPKPIEAASPKSVEVIPPKPLEVAPPEPVKTALAEAAAPMLAPEPKAALPVHVPEPARGGERWVAAYRATLASMGESQAAIVSDAAALSLEMTGLTRSYLTAAGDSAVAFFTARSLVDAVEAQLGFARHSIDALAGGSTRLGELGLRLAEDAAKPVLRSFAAE